jgi:hypothetical protein
VARALEYLEEVDLRFGEWVGFEVEDEVVR